ncbi:translation initiation factor IF-2 [Ketobacter sp. MCCC 1A13808]|uniref:translation initiation factor IF-2 n=1 Tax=Ketobacter sp. MCCC 1A13808 TaxID=2602738 RepID=UPI000F1D6252|nr:translation initiation factor IF-2 [Ketobacter sp. MCCC 1A13808]MVF12992.1 translation initiation factor IF-2 [Ketobacter sp. MCCC 1A13808]RLP53838.1 MAG: translation initiation factor IF-2 [Ketobacter sp.]
MAEVTVEQLADVVGIPVETLLQQMKDAGLTHKDAAQAVSDNEKEQLLAHLKRSHGGSDAGPKKITLKRKSVSTLKVSGSQGRSKTVNVEVRKKRTYVKRADVEAEEAAKAEEARLAEEAAKAEAAKKAQEAEATREADEARLEAERKALEEAKAEDEAKKAAAGGAASKKSSAKKSAPEKKEAAPKKPELSPEEQAAEDARRAEDAKRRDEARKKAEEEARQRTLEEARRIAQELEGRSETKTEEVLLEEEKDAIVKRAFEDSLAAEARQAKRARKVPKKKGRDKQPERKTISRVASRVNKHGFQNPTGPVVREVALGESITVSDLAQQMSVKGAAVVKSLFNLGIMATMNQTIDRDTAQLIIEEFGHNLKLVSEDAVEDSLVEHLEDSQKEGDLAARAPVVTIMGHVDHGKTSLLDHIRRTRVAAGEAGGITQHIGAYHVETGHGMITFLDTPGHAAFTQMRARGASCTDIVILVVAADDGMMPQTAEAIDHARAAGVPIIVAVNKIDKEDADPERVKSDLSQKEVISEEWGGDTQFVEVSALTGQGIDALLDAILLQAELLELKSVAEGAAQGMVIESRVDKGRGVVASLLVQNGILNQGDMVLAGEYYGRVRAMLDENGKQVDAAGPSIPVEILGLAGAPDAGEEFQVVPDERKAREVAEFRQKKLRHNRLTRQQAAKLENVFENMGAGECAYVNIVLKTDVRGSLEALQTALTDLSTDEVKVNIVSSGVGGINESDVNLALTSSAVVIGFNVRADNSARKLCQEEDIELRYYSVIYDIIEDVKNAMSGLLAPELREEIMGTAEVRDVFRSSKFGAVAGCKVIEGTLYRNKPIRVLRDDVVIYQGELESLRRFKDDVQEVNAGIECGIAVKSYNDVKEGDKIEVFSVKKVARSI